ncbi:MAG: NAD(P)H-dependent glycerol-3-phosphate dehydrogenase [Kiritimatiellia bacterium]|jgi:glycerol-3-phosphate dehydrogenase (NAD(P)+)
MKACIVGDGGWGTALALLLLQNGHDVVVWGPFEDYLAEIRATGENSRYLPGVKLPPALKWTSDPVEAAAGAELVVLATPSHFCRGVCERFAGLVPGGVDVVSVAKGFCEQTRRRLTVTAADALGIRNVAALSGPSHAEEVARGVPTAVVIASEDFEQARRLQAIFSGARFRAYTSTDPIGVELGGAVKNVLALAVGISDGLGFGDNSRAALITRGLAEMARLGTALGGQAETFAGLSGLGDLVVTCTSRHSRNRGTGERLGRGEDLATIQHGMKQVAEGVWNCAIVVELARAHGVEMPICETVKAVLESRIAPGDAFELLMGRDVKPEADGA